MVGWLKTTQSWALRLRILDDARVIVSLLPPRQEPEMLSVLMSVLGLVVAFFAGVVLGCVVAAIVFDALHRRLFEKRMQARNRQPTAEIRDMVRVSGDGWAPARSE